MTKNKYLPEKETCLEKLSRKGRISTKPSKGNKNAKLKAI